MLGSCEGHNTINKNKKAMKKIVMIILIAGIAATGCKKKRACIDARHDAGRTYHEMEIAYDVMMANPTNETVAAFQEAEYKDSVATAKMHDVCSKCKSCN